jgi:hypothetical protein
MLLDRENARRRHGWPPAGNLGIVSGCDARYDALSSDRVELLARAVLLVARMVIPEAAREAVLAKVIADLGN